ncbi:MAG: DUF2961 domain-containing protein [Lentisphaerae bacterium]|nr:DUF2961 domain-containing protein [Lentisphaerota bacterium]
MRARVFWVAGVILAGGIIGCSERRTGGEEINLVTCLEDLANVAVFERTPLGRAAMVSTYDRTGGNQDWGNLRKVDSDGYVTIAALTGPGCVKRIWMTAVPATEWAFFFDGEKIPRIRTKDRDLFGRDRPFEPPLCDIVSGGAYCYMPMPYAKSLRIALKVPELKQDARPYYHINYESYPAGTRVKSFPSVWDSLEKSSLEKARDAWNNRKANLEKAIVGCGEPVELLCPAKSETAWLDRERGGVLRAFNIEIAYGSDMDDLIRDRILRELVLRFYWDGAESPSVDVPLGDFFCNGINRRTFSSIVLGNLGGRFISRFPMPFKRGARATIRNDFGQDIKLRVSYTLESDTVDNRPVNYFHARWTQSLSQGMPLGLLSATGRGHYVGCYLIARGTDNTWNILEGDESFLVDNEVSPSLHGTGLEDYFNGAWYYYGLFDLATHGLLEKAAMNTAQYRFHLSDPVGFETSLNVKFEFGDANWSRGYMSGVAYWYQDSPHNSMTMQVPPDKRRPSFAHELMSVMSSLFELERIGLMEEARQRSMYYSKAIADKNLSEMFALRAARYDEDMYGFEKAKSVYQKYAIQKDLPEVARQAGQLLWFHESPMNALLGVHVISAYKLYMDGMLIGGNDNPTELSVWPVTLTLGEHEITLEVTPTQPNPWISVFLRAYGTNLVSDGTWECSRIKPNLRPIARHDEDVWCSVVQGDVMLPIMSCWRFVPNAFIKMQSGRQFMRPWVGWENPPTTAYLRKQFIVRSKDGDGISILEK